MKTCVSIWGFTDILGEQRWPAAETGSDGEENWPDAAAEGQAIRHGQLWLCQGKVSAAGGLEIGHLCLNHQHGYNI